ncbi:hypothetical protein SDC9_155397 [bioreactor metagenome]|uniref:Uncharacterized protein n=1 Tax=bioreactor metagenome TaxID=1076179 RepID=A0A645F3W0_9ZZZZ
MRHVCQIGCTRQSIGGQVQVEHLPQMAGHAKPVVVAGVAVRIGPTGVVSPAGAVGVVIEDEKRRLHGRVHRCGGRHRT